MNVLNKNEWIQVNKSGYYEGYYHISGKAFHIRFDSGLGVENIFGFYHEWDAGWSETDLKVAYNAAWAGKLALTYDEWPDSFDWNILKQV